MLFSGRNFLFLIFLSCITLNCVLCGESDDVSVKNDKLDSPSAEVVEEDQPTSGERFVAIHVGTLGMREELSPTLLGITHLVLTFLPAEYQLLTVISAAREVVAGVRYILVVNAERVENGERVVCSLEILEKPWITTEWGDKWRMLEGTNCTGSPNPLAPKWDQYQSVNPVFGGDKPKEVSGERLRKIEEEIITTTTPRDFYEIHDTTTELSVAELPDEMKALLDAYYLSGKPPSGGIVRENVASLASGVNPKTEPKIVNSEKETEDSFLVSTEAAEASSTLLSNEVPPQQITPIPQYVDEDYGQQQQILDPFFTIDPAQANVQEIERQKRELGRTEKEETLFLINRALEQLDAIDEDASRRVAIEVFAFKEAKIGDNCKIISAHAKVANSQCDENDENVRECMENVHPETAKLCAIEASICDGKSVKLKKTQCKPLPDKKVREKRSEFTVKGGIKQIDFSDESHPIHELVKDSLAGLGRSENGDVYSLVKINRASQQTVEGSLFRVNLDVMDANSKTVTCDMEVWDRPWLDNPRETKFDCDNSKKYNFRKRRSTEEVQEVAAITPVLVGGATPIENFQNNENVKSFVHNTLVSFNEKEGNNYELHRIVGATQQVVAGTLYKIQVEFHSKEPKKLIECELSVWERLWLNSTETEVSCDNDKKYKFRKRRSADEVPAITPSLVGGPKPIENFQNDEKVKGLVQNSLVSLNGKEGNSYKLHRIVGATHQVVAGSLYKIQVEFTKNDPNEIVKCELSVYERSWENKSETEVSCDNDKKYKFRKRRSADDVSLTPFAPGSPIPIENFENDEKVKGLVQNSLVSFNEKDGNSYELHRIVGATHQVVAGSIYKIQVEFKRTDSQEIVECELSILERLWEKKSETEVSCKNDKTYKFRSKRSLIYDHRRRTEDYEEEEKRLMHQRETLAHHEELFHKFQLKYSRAYHSSMEKSLRFRIFQNNLARIQMLNEREMGTAKYGVTEFADLTPTEYRMRTGLWKRNLDQNHISNPIAEIPNFKLPKNFDWRDKNVVSEVKNQGNCGSCWAFSVTGNIEGLHAIKTGQLEEYSEQELLDCDAIDGGCAGGLPDNAYKAIEELGGLELESDYPYRARKSECVFNKTMSHVKVSGAVDLPKNETAMQLWLVQNGPISIGINANAMQFYRGGVSHPWRPLCRHGGIDHGVLIVGYGVSEYPLFNKTLPYWIVKNSWGHKWGEQGYYRVFRGDNTCGINSMASSAVLA